MAAGIVADGRANVGGYGIEIAQKLFERFFLEVGVGGEGFVEVVNVGGVMFVVMEGHGFHIDERFEGGWGVGQRGKSERT